jgi:hypothetical protein
MIQSFENAATEDIFNGKDTKAARKACPQNLWAIAALHFLDFCLQAWKAVTS